MIPWYGKIQKLCIWKAPDIKFFSINEECANELVRWHEVCSTRKRVLRSFPSISTSWWDKQERCECSMVDEQADPTWDSGNTVLGGSLRLHALSSVLTSTFIQNLHSCIDYWSSDFVTNISAFIVFCPKCLLLSILFFNSVSTNWANVLSFCALVVIHCILMLRHSFITLLEPRP